ncbi:hypothetical protein [Curtobacterium sp. MCSS17_007]|uniref:hypothetical protein n=1 Tax=Curtobacterium sp. MCSS17_007 TaxID=2175646 RepID=UPI000DA7CD13|nr:hypothetical protein [Curtobacterium sp. MCSS17_007]WIE76730.1 hypothetical protein DEJ22_005585 [Curtobacterium sp. MCSS17_007]
MNPRLPDAVRRAARRAAWVGVVGSVVGAAIGIWLSLGERPVEVLLLVLGGTLAGGGLAATLTILVSQFWMRAVTTAPTLGLSLAEKRELQGAILTRASIAPELGPRAADQARVLAVTLPLAMAQSTLLSVGIVGSQVIGLASADSLAWFRVVLIAVLVVTGVIVIVVLRRNLIQVRRSIEALDTGTA